jgi:hypothetical protein
MPRPMGRSEERKMTQTLHEIVMQLNAEEGLTPDALWALKHLAEMKGDELAAAQKRVAALEAGIRGVLEDSTNLDKWRVLEAALAGDGDA